MFAVVRQTFDLYCYRWLPGRWVDKCGGPVGYA